jgi:serine/threonine protein kinase
VFLVPVEGRDAESVKILDFGISKVKDPSWGLQAPEGTVLGTPLYMSPEQVEGRVADADAATDQFALAVISYEMLTGRNPFQAESVSKIFSRVSYGDPTTMDIGRDVELVVRHGLAKRNGQRFPSVTDFSEALRAAAVGRARESQRSALVAYAAGEVAHSQSEGRSRRHNRGLVLGVGVLVSIAIAFGVGKATPRRWSRVQAGAAALAPKDLPPTVEPLATKPVDRPVIEEIEAAQEPTPEAMPSPERLPPPARRADRSPLAAPDGRPNHPGRAALSVPRRARSAPVPFPVDEDATMPATEP